MIADEEIDAMLERAKEFDSFPRILEAVRPPFDLCPISARSPSGFALVEASAKPSSLGMVSTSHRLIPGPPPSLFMCSWTHEKKTFFS